MDVTGPSVIFYDAGLLRLSCYDGRDADQPGGVVSSQAAVKQ